MSDLSECLLLLNKALDRVAALEAENKALRADFTEARELAELIDKYGGDLAKMAATEGYVFVNYANRVATLEAAIDAHVATVDRLNRAYRDNLPTLGANYRWQFVADINGALDALKEAR